MKQSKWCRIEEENGPERGEFPLGGQDNEVEHSVIQDIFTQTAQGREVKQDEKRSEARGRRIRSQARGKVQVRMFKYLSVAELTFLQIKCEICSKTFASKNSVQKHNQNLFASDVGIMTQCSEKTHSGSTCVPVHEDVKEESNGRSRFKNHSSAASNPRRRGEELILKSKRYHIQC